MTIGVGETAIVCNRRHVNGYWVNWARSRCPPPGVYTVRKATSDTVYLGAAGEDGHSKLYAFDKTPRRFYVVGTVRTTGKRDMLTITARPGGWEQRSELHPELNVTYVSHESYEELCEWLVCDMLAWTKSHHARDAMERFAASHPIARRAA